MPFPKVKSRRLALTALAVALGAGISVSALADSTVVRSTGPSAAKYPIGKKFKSGERVELVAGDRLVLMEKGTTRTLAKPGTFNATGPVQISQNMSTTVTRMISKGGTGRSRGGFTRGPGDTMAVAAAEMRAPNVWLLDYRQGGTFCVADPATLLLWRPDMAADQLLTIDAGKGAGAKSETVALITGANFRKWPTDTVPVQYDMDYQLSGAGLANPVTVRFKALTAMPESADEAVSSLLKNGCGGQLERLVDAMSEAEVAGGI